MTSTIIADSLKHLLSTSKQDSNRVLILDRLSYNILFSRPDSAMYYAQEGFKLAGSINYSKGLVLCKTDIGAVWWIVGDYAKANDVLLQSVTAAEKLNDPQPFEWSLSYLISSYRDHGNYQEALKYSFKGRAIHKYFSLDFWNMIVGSVYEEMNRPDSALFYLEHAELNGYTFLLLGHSYAKLKNSELALEFYNKSMQQLQLENNFKDLADLYVGFAKLYENENELDSAIKIAEKGFDIAQHASFKKGVLTSSLVLSKLYEKKDVGRALHYLQLAMAAKDSMNNIKKLN
jgi:tetratricopeptide (TPR) repeat protein